MNGLAIAAIIVQVIFFLVLARVIMSWLPLITNKPLDYSNPLVKFLIDVTEPLLAPLRRQRLSQQPSAPLGHPRRRDTSAPDRGDDQHSSPFGPLPIHSRDCIIRTPVRQSGPTRTRVLNKRRMEPPPALIQRN